MKCSGKVGNGPVNKRLNFGGDPDQGTDTDLDPDPYHDTGKTCLGGGMRGLSASTPCLKKRPIFGLL